MASRIPSLHKRVRIRNRKIAFFAVAHGVSMAVWYYSGHFIKTRQHDGHPGEQWMQEMLRGHGSRMRDNLGITKAGFRALETILLQKTGLLSTRYMSTTEQLGIFLYAVVSDLSMRKLAERFQRSTETINRNYHRMLRFFLLPAIQNTYVKHVSEDAEISDYIRGRYDFYPYLKDAVGAVDGTHIDVCPPATGRVSFRNRKGGISQNVLAVCDFDMRFTDVMVGMEGSTSDSALWNEAQRNGSVQIPDGKYVLGDAGLPLCRCLADSIDFEYILEGIGYLSPHIALEASLRASAIDFGCAKLL